MTAPQRRFVWRLNCLAGLSRECGPGSPWSVGRYRRGSYVVRPFHWWRPDHALRRVVHEATARRLW